MATTTKELAYECADCDRAFTTKGGLTLHRRYIHPTDVPLEELAVRERPNDRGGQPPADGWQERFVEGLVKTQLVDEAARYAGISRAHAYRVRQRDPVFAAMWEEAVERSTEILEAAAMRRAVAGSDILAMFLLKSRKPEMYRENVQHKHVVEGSLTFEIDGKQPIQLDSTVRRQAAELLQASVDAEIPEADVVEEGETSLE